jgi:UPF0755 protein
MLISKIKKFTAVMLATLLFVVAIAAVYVLAVFPTQSISLVEARLVNVPSGTGFNQLCRQLAAEHVISRCGPLKWYSKFDPALRLIKAGSFWVKPGINHQALLQLLSGGQEHQFAITFVEGEKLSEILAKLAAKDNLIHDITDPDLLAQQLNSPHQLIEGLLFPDTYYYPAGGSSFDIISRAYQSMNEKLRQQWQNRAMDLPYANAYEALIMASIIEKETGQAYERDLIASVFVNRLNKKMRLQTDPTVIYGMGERYKGNITRKDLRQKTAYNTYRINGLPPTPIAMPGLDAITAALNPATTDFYYFVSKKDSSHYFSQTLKQHNQAVRKYQLGKTK